MLKNNNRKRIVVVLGLVGLMAGFFVSQLLRSTHTLDVSEFHGTILDTPREVRPFNLMGTHHQVFNHDSLKHQWTMMFFGFTTCPSICPVTMTELSKMFRLLEEKGVKPLPQVVFLSLDPERDTLPKIERYVTAFHPQFLGARGESEQSVKAMAQEMGIAFEKIIDKENRGNYNIEHSGTIMLFNPQGQLTAFFTMPHQAALLAEDYQLMIKAQKSG